MRRLVLLTLTVAGVAARQYFQQQPQNAEIQVAPADDSPNTAHGVWKPKRSAWLNDSPPPDRKVGRRDFSDLEPVAEASIEMKVQSEELLTSSEKHDGTKRIVKHIRSLEPSGYEGGNEGNNLEAWQSVQSSNHGGVFPDGYDGLSAMPRTLINEMVGSSSGAPFQRPPPPPPQPRPNPPITQHRRPVPLTPRNYPRYPPPPSRRHVPEMRPPGFIPPEMTALSPLSGDFDGEQPLDRSGRHSGDSGGTGGTTKEYPLTTTTKEEITTTTSPTEEPTTTEITTSSSPLPPTTPDPPQDPTDDNDTADIGEEIEKKEVKTGFTMKTPISPPVFENSVTAVFEEPDDDDFDISQPSKKSTLPNVEQSKPVTQAPEIAPAPSAPAPSVPSVVPAQPAQPSVPSEASAPYVPSTSSVTPGPPVPSAPSEPSEPSFPLAETDETPATPFREPSTPSVPYLPSTPSVPNVPLAPSVPAPSENTSTDFESPAPVIEVTSPPQSREHETEEGPYEPLNPPQPAQGGHVEETSGPGPSIQPAPQPEISQPAPGPVEHKYEIPAPEVGPGSIEPAPVPQQPQPLPQPEPQPAPQPVPQTYQPAPQLPVEPQPQPQQPQPQPSGPEPVPTLAPQPAEHTYGAQGPDIAPVATAAPYIPQETQAPIAPSNPEPIQPNPSQGIAVAPQPTGNSNFEVPQNVGAKPSYPGQSSYNNLEEDHGDVSVAELPAPEQGPAPTPAPSLPGESSFGNLEEDHEGDHHLVEGPNTGSSGSSESTGQTQTSGESSFSDLDRDRITAIDPSNIDNEQIPQVVVPTKPSGGFRNGGMVENTAPHPTSYNRPHPIKVQVNPATKPYRPRPSPAPRIQPSRPYNPQPAPIQRPQPIPQPQPQPIPQNYIQRPTLSLPFQQPQYPAPIPFQPRPSPFVPLQPMQQRPSPPGCCGGQLFSQQGGLCMPINFNSCQQQQNNCGGGCGGGCSGVGSSCGGGCNSGGSSCGGGCNSGGGCGGGCGSACGGGGGGCSPSCCQPQTSACCNQMVSTCCQPQQMACCNQQVQTCCPQPAQQSCCCPSPAPICRHKRSLGYAMGLCQRRRA